MTDLNLAEMKSTSHFFTWTNGHVWSRLYRALCNPNWVMNYKHIVVEFKDKETSDHTRIYTEINEYKKARAPFRFLNVLTEHEEFQDVITQSRGQHVEGTPMFRVWKKLQICKDNLKQLATTYLSGVNERVLSAGNKLHAIYRGK